jgi:hypothetical protein
VQLDRRHLNLLSEFQNRHTSLVLSGLICFGVITALRFAPGVSWFERGKIKTEIPFLPSKYDRHGVVTYLFLKYRHNVKFVPGGKAPIHEKLWAVGVLSMKPSVPTNCTLVLLHSVVKCNA